MLKAKHSLLSKTGFIGKKEVEETFTAKGREKFVDQKLGVSEGKTNPWEGSVERELMSRTSVEN